jgi:hypothetical protein
MLSESVAKEYRVERLTGDNLGALDELYAAVYGRRPEDGYFRKKYDTGYTGATWLGYIAYNAGNTVVAYYGVMPCLIRYGTETILSAQSGDTMTHPGFRYKGMFVELSLMTFQLCRNEGVRLLFGFPNQNSYHGAITRLGWKQTETMECFIVPVRTLPLAAAARRFPWLKPLYRLYSRLVIGSREQKERKMPNSVLQDGYNGLWRSGSYMQYRTYSDNYVLDIGGATVWLKADSDLVVGDMVLGTADFDIVLAALRRLAVCLGLRRILFQSCPGTGLYRKLAERYEGAASFPVLFQDLGSGLLPETIKFTFADIDIF